MTDQTIAMWLAIMLVIEVCAILSLGWLGVSGRVLQLHKMVAVGVLLLAFGLGVQVVRSLHYFEFGRYPVDKVFPWWVLKDLGGSLVIFYLSFIWRKEHQPARQTQAAKRRKK